MQTLYVYNVVHGVMSLYPQYMHSVCPMPFKVMYNVCTFVQLLLNLTVQREFLSIFTLVVCQYVRYRQTQERKTVY